MASKMVLFELAVLAFCIVTSQAGGRGDKFLEMWKAFTAAKKAKSIEKVEVVRVPRKSQNPKWSNNGDVVIIRKTTVPPTTTTTTTKSPEQILKEEEAERRRLNPKGFLIFSNREKNKEKYITFNIEEDKPKQLIQTIDKEVKKMDKKLDKLETRCLTNSDCTNSTCCMISNVGVGTCVVKPHRIGQQCSELCPCVNNFECRIKEIDKIETKIITLKHCAIKIDDVVKEAEFAQILLQKLAAAKKGSGVKQRRVKKILK